MHVFIHALIAMNVTPLHAITQSAENDTPQGATVTHPSKMHGNACICMHKHVCMYLYML